jgi:hypothetical protein
VLYKDRERDSKEFLDMVSVTDRSKMTMVKNPEAQARRLIEERRNAKAQKAAKAVSRISLDVIASSSSLPSISGLLHGGWGRLDMNSFIQTASSAASEAAMYSASVVDLATTLCLELLQLTAPPFITNTYPD